MSSDDPEYFPELTDQFSIQQLININHIVANCTTPGNYFHLLRSENIRDMRDSMSNFLADARFVFHSASLLLSLHQSLFSVILNADPALMIFFQVPLTKLFSLAIINLKLNFRNRIQENDPGQWRCIPEPCCSAEGERGFLDSLNHVVVIFGSCQSFVGAKCLP